jgi:hypothetical protein
MPREDAQCQQCLHICNDLELVAALVIDGNGDKHPLGLVDSLIERGPKQSERAPSVVVGRWRFRPRPFARGIGVIIDSAKALSWFSPVKAITLILSVRCSNSCINDISAIAGSGNCDKRVALPAPAPATDVPKYDRTNNPFRVAPHLVHM